MEYFFRIINRAIDSGLGRQYLYERVFSERNATSRVQLHSGTAFTGARKYAGSCEIFVIMRLNTKRWRAKNARFSKLMNYTLDLEFGDRESLTCNCL